MNQMIFFLWNSAAVRLLLLCEIPYCCVGKLQCRWRARAASLSKISYLACCMGHLMLLKSFGV